MLHTTATPTANPTHASLSTWVNTLALSFRRSFLVVPSFFCSGSSFLLLALLSFRVFFSPVLYYWLLFSGSSILLLATCFFALRFSFIVLERFIDLVLLLWLFRSGCSVLFYSRPILLVFWDLSVSFLPLIAFSNSSLWCFSVGVIFWIHFN